MAFKFFSSRHLHSSRHHELKHGSSKQSVTPKHRDSLRTDTQLATDRSEYRIHFNDSHTDESDEAVSSSRNPIHGDVLVVTHELLNLAASQHQPRTEQSREGKILENLQNLEEITKNDMQHVDVEENTHKTRVRSKKKSRRLKRGKNGDLESDLDYLENFGQCGSEPPCRRRRSLEAYDAAAHLRALNIAGEDHATQRLTRCDSWPPKTVASFCVGQTPESSWAGGYFLGDWAKPGSIEKILEDEEYLAACKELKECHKLGGPQKLQSQTGKL